MKFLSQTWTKGEIFCEGKLFLNCLLQAAYIYEANLGGHSYIETLYQVDFWSDPVSNMAI